MNRHFASLALVAGLFAAGTSFAQAPAGAPAGSTGACKDGSYTSNATKKGACAGHKGVKDWFAVAAAAPAMKMATPAAATTMTPAATMAPAATKTPAAMKTSAAPATAPAAGGGPGQVWVNTSSKVYHCSGTKYYGKTKQGEYMTEAAAKAAGAHADHGKACS
ncbi:MAG: DUF3761 domain-containing protein [Pseudomonadota bacterium]|nr:DUF3761 domain-containing protein [Pseudomonadota bacterium]